MNNNYIINIPYDPKFLFCLFTRGAWTILQIYKNRNQAIILDKIEFINLSSSHFYEQ